MTKWYRGSLGLCKWHIDRLRLPVLRNQPVFNGNAGIPSKVFRVVGHNREVIR